jgi:hypothetical protein
MAGPVAPRSDVPSTVAKPSHAPSAGPATTLKDSWREQTS